MKGLENVRKDKPVLVVSNHQSNMDIPVLLGYLNKPIGFVSKAEIKVPSCTNLDGTYELCIMDRSDRRQSLQAIKDGIELLKNGHSIVIFPEGTKVRVAKLESLRLGVFTLL